MQFTYVLWLVVCGCFDQQSIGEKGNIHRETLIIFFSWKNCKWFAIRNVHKLFLIVIVRSIRYSFIFSILSEKFNFRSHTKFLGPLFSHYHYTQWEYQRRANWALSLAPLSHKNCVHVRSTSDRMLIGLNEGLTNYDSQHSRRKKRRKKRLWSQSEWKIIFESCYFRPTSNLNAETCRFYEFHFLKIIPRLYRRQVRHFSRLSY